MVEYENKLYVRSGAQSLQMHLYATQAIINTAARKMHGFNTDWVGRSGTISL